MIWKNLPKDNHTWAFYYYLKRIGDDVRAIVKGDKVDIIVNNRIALIDGDIVSYRCGFAAEHKKYNLEWKDEEGNKLAQVFDNKTDLNNFLKEHEGIVEYEWDSDLSVEPISYVLSTVKHMIEHICAGAGTDKYIVFLSGENNFRKEIATLQKYKGNRDKQRKPIRINDIHEYLKEHHPTVVVDHLEADDLLADGSYALNALGYDPVICTIDKDMMQVPGKYYSFVKGERFNVTSDTAKKSLYAQILTGDSGDNIPGIRGVGPITAEKILQDVEPDAYEKVVLEKWCDYVEQEDCPFRESIGYEFIVKEIKQLLKVGVAFNNGEATKEEAAHWLREHIPERIRENYSLSA